MRAGRGGGRLRIAGADRGGKVEMPGTGVDPQLVVGDGVEERLAQGGGEAGEQLGQDRVVRRRDHGLVKGEVGLDEGGVPRFGASGLTPPQRPLEPSQVVGVAAGGGQPGRLQLERVAHLEDVKDGGASQAGLEVGIERDGSAHEGARALPGLDQAGAGQRPDRLAHG